MARGRGPKRRRNKSRGAEADKGANVAQEQCTAPMSGLNDVLAPRANASTGTWQRLAEHVATVGKREQREDLGVVMQSLETREYPDFEHERRQTEAPDHTRQTFAEYHACRERCERFNEKLEAWEDTCEWVTDQLVSSIDKQALVTWKRDPVWRNLVETSSFLELLGAHEENE